MSGIIKNENAFIGCEYKEVTTSRDMEAAYADGYENFGWKLEGTFPLLQGLFTVAMKFKHDRKIRNKAELTRLQRQFDVCVSEIMALKKSKIGGASAAAHAIGIVGCGFLTGAVFAYLAGMLPLMVILTIPGFAG